MLEHEPNIHVLKHFNHHHHHKSIQCDTHAYSVRIVFKQKEI